MSSTHHRVAPHVGADYMILAVSSVTFVAFSGFFVGHGAWALTTDMSTEHAAALFTTDLLAGILAFAFALHVRYAARKRYTRGVRGKALLEGFLAGTREDPQLLAALLANTDSPEADAFREEFSITLHTLMSTHTNGSAAPAHQGV